jgi:putative phage-type endonuclease
VSVFDERKEWLEQRRQGLGGTDIAAILGLSPWKNALDVYLGKLGMTEQKEPTEAMFWGNAMERIIAQRYVEITGRRVATGEAVAACFPNQPSGIWNGQTILEHPDCPVVLGTPDGIAFEAGRGVEIKTAGFKGQEWGKAGTDEVPHHYRLQVAQYMAITNLPAWDIAVLFSGNRFEVFTVARDFELEEVIILTARQFWQENIERRVPPPLDGSDTWKQYLARTHAIGSTQILTETPEGRAAAQSLKEAQARKAAAEYDETLAKNQLMQIVGDAKGMKFGDGGKAQWVRSRPEEVIDWEAVAKSLSATPEQIAPFTSQKSKSAYIRYYAGKEQQ